MKHVVTGRVRSLAAAVRSHAEGAAAGTPGSVHDLRVACRRLDATLRLWGGGASARSARQAARALRRAAGPVREAEVLQALLARRMAALARVPAATRSQWRAKLAASATPVALPAAELERLANSSEAVAARFAARGVRVARAKQRAGRWRKTALAELERGLEDGGAAALHRARLALKYWRYAEESRVRAKDGRSRPRERRIRAWQQALGELNDLSSLSAFLARQGRMGRRLVPAIERRRSAELKRLRRRHAAHAKR